MQNKIAHNGSLNPIKTPEINTGTPEISMAPLIDVVFLLLIFFMVTTVFPENRGLMIEKPESSITESLALKKMTFTVSATGEIEFQKRAISVKDISRLVREQLLASPDTAVLLQVDKNASTEIFIKVLDASKAGGAKQVGIATNTINEEF